MSFAANTLLCMMLLQGCSHCASSRPCSVTATTMKLMCTLYKYACPHKCMSNLTFSCTHRRGQISSKERCTAETNHSACRAVLCITGLAATLQMTRVNLPNQVANGQKEIACLDLLISASAFPPFHLPLFLPTVAYVQAVSRTEFHLCHSLGKSLKLQKRSRSSCQLQNLYLGYQGYRAGCALQPDLPGLP